MVFFTYDVFLIFFIPLSIVLVFLIVRYGEMNCCYDFFSKRRKKKSYYEDEDLEEGINSNFIEYLPSEREGRTRQRIPTLLDINKVVFYNPNKIVEEKLDNSELSAFENVQCALPKASFEIVHDVPTQVLKTPRSKNRKDLVSKWVEIKEESPSNSPLNLINGNIVREPFVATEPIIELLPITISPKFKRGIAKSGPLKQITAPYALDKQMAFQTNTETEDLSENIQNAAFKRYDNIASETKAIHALTTIEKDEATSNLESRLPKADFIIDADDLRYGELIGVGAFGRVYKGKWRGTSVAIKVLLNQNLNNQVLEEFKSEVAVLAALRHPNVCLYLGASLELSNLCIVTELLSKGSLWDVLQNKSNELPWHIIKKMAIGSACGLLYLHTAKPPILHRDLKSANLLLDESFNAKLSDFGLARVKAVTQTMTGQCGTMHWMAPEILANQRYTEKADVYSFGIVMWELLARECPYGNTMNPIQIAIAVLNEGKRPEIPSLGVPPPSFVTLMVKCWDTFPNNRPSFANIVEDLEKM